MDDYYSITTEVFATMRLTIEGAVVLYLEDDEVKKLLRNMDKFYYAEYRDLLIMMIMLDSGTRLALRFF